MSQDPASIRTQAKQILATLPRDSPSIIARRRAVLAATYVPKRLLRRPEWKG
jgi:hypothetical protein